MHNHGFYVLVSLYYSLSKLDFNPLTTSFNPFKSLLLFLLFFGEVAHRTKRPWQGAVEPPALGRREKYDRECYLCPGNTRAGGLLTENYEETFVFEVSSHALLRALMSEVGDLS